MPKRSIQQRYQSLGKVRKNSTAFKGARLQQRSKKIIVCKNSGQQPVILIKTVRTGIHSKKILRNLEIDFSQNYKIETIQDQVFQGVYTSITLRSNDDAMMRVFFQVMESFLKNLVIPIKDDDLEIKLNKLIEIFQNLQIDTGGTPQGLWAELFLISLSKNISQSVEYWHQDENTASLYDFSKGNYHVEVKSTLSKFRKHGFSLDQSHPNKSFTVVIASFLLEKDDQGTSIDDLMKKIKASLKKSKPELLIKFDDICIKTLGNKFKDSIHRAFNEKYAEEELLFFDIEDIPNIDELYLFESGISKVKFTSDLGFASPVKKAEYKKKSQLFRNFLV